MIQLGNYHRSANRSRVIPQEPPCWPHHLCVHELFERQVTITPDAVAVSDGNHQLTYSELNAHANQCAHHLQQLTSGMDVPIGICMERSLEMAIGVLAILKAGAAYLPLDPTYPHETLQHMLDHALAPVVLTQRTAAASLPLTRAAKVFVDAVPTGAVENPRRRIAPGNLAYVTYTGGYTGLPRAVAMPHRPLVNLLSWHSRTSTFASPARTLQFASLSSPLAFQEIFSTWCTGGTLILISEETRCDPAQVLAFLDAKRIERLFLPFPVLPQLAKTSLRTGIVPRHLREITSTGEQLRIGPATVAFFEKLRGCRLHNQYSVSESHVATSYTLAGPPDKWPVLPPLGHEIANVQIYLLGADLKPVPRGTPGEIFIGGECLAQGYLHRPNLTRERFAIDRFNCECHRRLYRTGDLGCRLADGHIAFLGRSERQTDNLGVLPVAQRVISGGNPERGLGGNRLFVRRNSSTVARGQTGGSSQGSRSFFCSEGSETP